MDYVKKDAILKICDAERLTAKPEVYSAWQSGYAYALKEVKEAIERVKPITLVSCSDCDHFSPETRHCDVLNKTIAKTMTIYCAKGGKNERCDKRIGHA